MSARYRITVVVEPITDQDPVFLPEEAHDAFAKDAVISSETYDTVEDIVSCVEESLKVHAYVFARHYRTRGAE